MPTLLQEKTGKLIQTTATLGGVGLLIAEDEKNHKDVFEKAREDLANQNYKECSDYLDMMDALSEGRDKLFYSERGEKLDGLILEIIAEFEAGIVSLADRKHNIGLKTATWNPARTSIVVIMSRTQVEASYPRLFEYINFTQSF